MSNLRPKLDAECEIVCRLISGGHGLNLGDHLQDEEASSIVKKDLMGFECSV
jgi:hypothetical protein